jgi:hypothetical protein
MKGAGHAGGRLASRSSGRSVALGVPLSLPYRIPAADVLVKVLTGGAIPMGLGAHAPATLVFASFAAKGGAWVGTM